MTDLCPPCSAESDAWLESRPRVLGLTIHECAGDVEPIGTTRDRLLTTSDGRQYVSRSYGPWEAAGVQPMDGQEELPWC